jgi:hypothetical protein
MRHALPALVLLGSFSFTAQAQDAPVGALEDFALSLDRAATVKNLIPGTEPYYYFNCLERQHAGDLASAAALLRAWVQRHGEGGRTREIEQRQALLMHGADPDSTYRYLIDELGLRFDQQPSLPGAETHLPTVLDPGLVSPAAFAARALERHPRSLAGFEAATLRGLVGGQLSDRRLGELLDRLQRPDIPGLVELVVRDLGRPKSRGFGSRNIHGRLLLEQLDACRNLMPRLGDDGRFIATYLQRLAPGPDLDWRQDFAEREAYLERLWEFVRTLAPAHNGLKAHVLHHRLRHDLAQGSFDRERFLAWLRLPRRTGWTNPRYLRRRAAEELVKAGEEFSTELGPAGDDEALLQTYLDHFLADAPDTAAFADYVRSEVLARRFAETKILRGVGDMERWYSMLDDPAYYEQLQRRVEIDFAPDQPRSFGAHDPVTIELDLKNVDTLLVKVFEIDTLGYYLAEEREIDASLDLDGLVGSEESTYEYDENPLRRVRRRFEFPALTGPGVYVVEFIGGGLSSRVLIRKGRLQLRERLSAAGHAFRIFDGDGVLQARASIWLGGREYVADEDGEIYLPYSSQPGPRALVLRSKDLCTLAHFQHSAETYRLEVGALVDREALLAGDQAQLLLRPRLSLNGQSVPLSLLEKPVLSIVSTGAGGVRSTLEAAELELRESGELVHPLRVPPGTRTLEVSLRGRVQSLSLDEPVPLASNRTTFELNGIEATAQTDCPLLGRDDRGWFLDVLGKNGEPRPGRVLDLELTHGGYTEPLRVQLQTDSRGRARLGSLAGVVALKSSGLPSGRQSWRLDEQSRSWPRERHGAEGAVVRVPYPGVERAMDRALVRKRASLIELRGGEFFADRFDRLALVDGYVELRGLTAGDYDLWLAGSGHPQRIKITAGSLEAGWIRGRDRWLEAGADRPLNMDPPRVDGDRLAVRVQGAGPGARVHVFADRYATPYGPLEALGVSPGAGPGEHRVQRAGSDYQARRTISDEYRYVLERRFARIFPGNMLEQPGLLLNPMAVLITPSMIGLGGGAGGKFGARHGGARSGVGPVDSAAPESTWQNHPGVFPNLDFLPRHTPILTNQRLDAQGLLNIPLEALGSGQLVRVVVVDGDELVAAEIALPSRPFTPRDRRLRASLDPELHLTEQRRIEFLGAGERATLADVNTAEAEVFDDLRAVYRLYRTLSGDGELAKFAFLLDWPGLSAERKGELYSEFACHELHLFLYRKDRPFFDAVVRPYLANKGRRTFLDHWLLGDDLGGYLEPWAFGRLNVMERILLARRLPGEAEAIARLVREQVELRPQSPGEEASMFAAAVDFESLQLDAGLAMKMRKAREDLDDKPAPREEQDFQLGESNQDALPDSASRAKDLRHRVQTRRLTREMQPTRRYIEHQYWRRLLDEQGPGLVRANGFWLDLAQSPAGDPFLSPHFAQATGSINEMLLALALLDLPFEAGEHTTTVEGTGLTIEAASPLLLVRKELAEAQLAPDGPRVLVAQDLFRLDAPTRDVNGRPTEAFVTGPFEAGVGYGCRVVLTNPTGVRRDLELLLQIPAGSIPLGDGFMTRGVPVVVEAYGTAKVEYAFYFPTPGQFGHYPVHAGEDGALLAWAEARTLRVTAEPALVDVASWEHVSGAGTGAQVLAFLEQANLLRVDLSAIAWRLRDKPFFEALTSLLRARHVYDDGVWSFALHHRRDDLAREYLRHANAFIERCGPALSSDLLEIDPAVRGSYEHVDYRPLVNARAHPFAGRRVINDQDLSRQYGELLNVLAHRPVLNDDDWLSVTYYLLLQGRVGEALDSFARVDPKGSGMGLQYDYLAAYLDFYSEKHALARGIAEAYRDHPVPRWRDRFRTVLGQLDEAQGVRGRPGVGAQDGDGGSAPADEPSLDLRVASGRITLSHTGVERVELRYYPMDIEFRFSSSPFVAQGGGAFAYVRPNRADLLELPPGGEDLVVELPAEFARTNVLIEARGGGVTSRQAHYAGALSVQTFESAGQIKVTRVGSGEPLAKVYVKVYAREGGSVRFHKDGYTDLRGRFDYVSVSGDGRAVERFALLVLSEDDGAVIREVEPPIR